MLVIQILLLLALLGSMLLTWKRNRQGVISRREAILWSALWIGAAAFILWPDASTQLARIVGVGRGTDLIVYGSVIGLFVLVFNLHVSLDRVERKLTDLVRREALKDLPKDRS